MCAQSLSGSVHDRGAISYTNQDIMDKLIWCAQSLVVAFAMTGVLSIDFL